MMLDVEIVKALPRFAINLALACESGKLMALVGPSGAGKTTLMRIIAGLERPDHGRISFDAETWLDTGAGVCLSPQRRNLGYVFQEYTLFPHLTVFGNVAFAARDQGSVTELLKRFEIWHLRERKPRKLSGGERQRVALAQALARRPRILLLDEPFSALDAVSRRKLQGELGKIKAEFNLPIIHITHDLKEAESLADRLLPMVEGRREERWLAGQSWSSANREMGRPGDKIIALRDRLDLKNASGG